MIRRLPAWILALSLLLPVAWGCAPDYRQAREMLAVDYSHLSDDELKTYYRRLNDELAMVEREARRSDRPAPPEAAELRERTNAVRAEIRRRGLTP